MNCVDYILILILTTMCISSSVSSNELKYSEKELQLLNEFRERILNVLNPKDKFRNSNDYLITWIRDRDYDIEKAEDKFRKSQQWRRENGVESFLDDKEALEFQALQFPYTDLGADRNGLPTFVIPIGSWRIRKYVIAGKPRLVPKQINIIYEKAIRSIKLSWESGNRNITQWNLIVDMAGFNLKEHACLGCIPLQLEFITIYEHNYPGTAKRAVLINSPKVFEPILRLMRPLMSPATRNILQVFTVNKLEWKNYLNSFLDLQNKKF